MDNLKPKDILKHTFETLDQVIEQKNMEDPDNGQEEGENQTNQNREEEPEEPVSD